MQCNIQQIIIALYKVIIDEIIMMFMMDDVFMIN
jgi:hypothetical protein